jgi:pimeloyl-ACP methyl ester carboxylesterase
LLLPGLDGTARLFDRFEAAMPKHWSARRVSYPRDAERSLEQLVAGVLAKAPDDEAWVMVAESFSGPVALRVASHHPRGLEAVVLVASFLHPPMGGAASALLQLGSGVAARVSPPAILIRKLMVGAEASNELVAEVRAAVSSVAPSVLAGRLRMLTQVDAAPDLSACSVPVMLLTAKHDQLVRPNATAGALGLAENVSFVELEGPHLLLQTRPDACVATLSEFFDGLGE